MNIRTIKRNAKILLFIVALMTAGAKGKDYIPSLTPTTETTASPVQTASTPAAVEKLKKYIPDDRLQRPHQLLSRKNYIASYNRQTKCPNWVLWELTREEADGDVKRPDYAFHEDMEVPAPRAELTDYRGSGYDRGHMCPAGDNKWDDDAMYESFLMTNICPQNRQLNSGLWNQIEMQCRYWAEKHGGLYVVCGPIYDNGKQETIGTNQVAVPEAFFKVILCMEGKPKGIAFVCKNAEGNRKKDGCVNTINQVERVTGYTFFPNLDADIAHQTKNRADLKDW